MGRSTGTETISLQSAINNVGSGIENCCLGNRLNPRVFGCSPVDFCSVWIPGKYVIAFYRVFMISMVSFALQVLQENAEFRSLGAAMLTLISTTLGEFDFYGWVDANRILAPIMFFAFNVIVFFILLSVFMAVLNISARSVRQSLVEQSNDFEVLNFILRRIRLWLGFKSEVCARAKKYAV